jgi:GTP-binding protein LepA
MNTGGEYTADEIGVLKLDYLAKPELATGNVGYIVTGIKQSKEIKVGDTITLANKPSVEPIKGFEDVKPMVFAGIFPIDNDDFEDLRDSL